MPKRFTIDDVKNYIEEHDTNNYCTLLSEEYINVTTPLQFKCNVCGNTFQKDFMHLKRTNTFCCQKCSKKIAASKRSIGIDAIKDFIKVNDTNNLCTLLSTTYINETTPLDFKCNKCGKIFQRDWTHLKRGRFQCPACGIHQGATYKKYSEEEVRQDIALKGYTMIGSYVNASTPFAAICSRGHHIMLRYSYYKVGHSGCALCSHINQRGENHPNWQGGSSEVRDCLRKSIKSWKQQVLIRDNFKCALSQKHEDLVVHHLNGYNLLLSQASINTGIPILSKLSDYNKGDYNILQNELIRLHSVENGITLTRTVHDLFHSIYGKGNNTKEQFEEFSLRYKKGEFDKK